MQLLVSVRTAVEAGSACAGGADIVDAKEPAAGALGRVTPTVWADIRAGVPAGVPLSAALGDAGTPAEVGAALAGLPEGFTFVKLGCLGVSESGRVGRLLEEAVRIATARPGGPRVVGVAYADWRRTGSLDPAAFPDLLARAGAHGLLIDTAIKDGSRLPDLLSAGHLATIAAALRSHRLLFAVGGSLDAGDLAFVRASGADIVGVRGAVAVGGRAGPIDSTLVARLATLLHPATGPSGPGARPAEPAAAT